MISYLEGKIIKKTEKYVILLVGGVGYKIFLTSSYISELKQEKELKLYTYLNVKEDSLTLYGFKIEAELELFELLISVSGVGPKAALAIISLDTPERVAGAIIAEDFSFVGSVSGIGKKTAQKVILELKDKVSSLSFGLENDNLSKDKEVIDALVVLGFIEKNIRKALKDIPKEIEKVEDRIKEALKILGK